MLGKTPMWRNPKRERDFISFRKDISTTTIQFPTREKYLTTPKTVPNFCLGKRAQKSHCSLSLRAEALIPCRNLMTKSACTKLCHTLSNLEITINYEM